MSHPLLGDQYNYHKDSGYFISERHERIARIVHDYDPEIELGWIPPDKRDADDTQPFCLIHNHPNGTRQVISYWREDQVDERILEWLFENDFKKHRPEDIYNRMQAKNLARELYEAQVREDEHRQRVDRARHILRSPLHKYTDDLGRVWRE